MTAASNLPSLHDRGLLPGILARLAQVAGAFLFQAVLLFAVAWRLDWAWAWLFLAIYVLSVAVNAIVMLRGHQEIIAERGTAELTRAWDKLFGGLWGLMQYLFTPVLAALDFRLAWSSGMSVTWHLIGALLLAGGLALFSWAMFTNAFFSTVARIQAERGHTVCSSGPYRIVRHPGYAGAILQTIGIPILLGSWWALIPGVLGAAAMVARTLYEDRMLKNELVGYSDYAKRVRYRLIPGIW